MMRFGVADLSSSMHCRVVVLSLRRRCSINLSMRRCSVIDSSTHRRRCIVNLSSLIVLERMPFLAVVKTQALMTVAAAPCLSCLLVFRTLVFPLSPYLWLFPLISDVFDVIRTFFMSGAFASRLTVFLEYCGCHRSEREGSVERVYSRKRSFNGEQSALLV